MEEASMKAWIVRRGLPAVLALGLVASAAPTAYAAGSLTPASHDFGDQTVGTTSASFFFILSNFCLTQDPGDPFFCGSYNPVAPAVNTTGDFAQTNNCPQDLIPIFFFNPVSCTITVTFTPTSAGSRTGTLSGASGLTSSLSGTGIAVPTAPGSQLPAQPGTQVALKAAI